jgi:hypothetical protein
VKPEKPCDVLDYCPYGRLVEFFPLHGVVPAITKQSEWMQGLEPRDGADACDVFGHDCPVFFCAENFS